MTDEQWTIDPETEQQLRDFQRELSAAMARVKDAADRTAVAFRVVRVQWRTFTITAHVKRRRRRRRRWLL